MNKSAEYKESKQSTYVAQMVESLKNVPRTPPFTGQPESTLRALDAQSKRSPSQDDAYKNRPIAENWMAVPGATNVDEMVGRRNLDEREVAHVEAIRRRPKNSVGQVDIQLTTSPERKAAAAGAFLCAGHATLSQADKEKLTKLSGYTPPPQEVFKDGLPEIDGLGDFRNPTLRETLQDLWHYLFGK